MTDFPRHRCPTRGPRQRTIGRAARHGRAVYEYDRPAARALSGSIHGTQGAHPGRGGGWGAGL
eukprot:6988735-Prymnesium_polylepis.1